MYTCIILPVDFGICSARILSVVCAWDIHTSVLVYLCNCASIITVVCREKSGFRVGYIFKFRCIDELLSFQTYQYSLILKFRKNFCHLLTSCLSHFFSFSGDKFSFCD